MDGRGQHVIRHSRADLHLRERLAARRRRRGGHDVVQSAQCERIFFLREVSISACVMA